MDKLREALRGNKKAEAASYGLVVVGLVAALGPWILVTVAGLILLNEFVDG